MLAYYKYGDKVILILGLVDNRMRDFIKGHKFHDRFMIIHKICNVKHLKEDVEVIIPFGFIDKYDNVSNTYIQMYEFLLTLNVKKIYYYNEHNINRLKELASEFNVELIKKYNE